MASHGPQGVYTVDVTFDLHTETLSAKSRWIGSSEAWRLCHV